MSSNLNTNKAAAAILAAGLIAMLTGKVTEFMYDGGPKHPGHHSEEKRGYSVEVTEVDPAAGGAAAPTEAPDISALYATADVKAGGEYIAKKCTVCHSIDKGGANKVGPHLWGVVNRTVGGLGDFNYSTALKSHNTKKWDFDELNHFLWGPNKYMKGTIMSFAGISKDQERANVIAYLATEMSDSPIALPKPSAKAVEAAAEAAKPAAPAAAPAIAAEPAKQ